MSREWFKKEDTKYIPTLLLDTKGADEPVTGLATLYALCRGFSIALSHCERAEFVNERM